MAIDFHHQQNIAAGPIVFFPDPTAEGGVAAEIRGAISRRRSFYAYREPGDLLVSFGSSEKVAVGFGIPGFVIAPFEPGEPWLTIPWQPEHGTDKECHRTMTFPVHSTSEDKHRSGVLAIQQRLRSLPEEGKTVLATVTVREGELDVAEIFADLTRRYPEAFVFCFSTPQTGCWVGASPELLLKSHGGVMETMALAGTRPSGPDASGWDAKNLAEQDMVRVYISDTLTRHGLTPEEKGTQTRTAGPVEHICTPFSVNVPNDWDTGSLHGLLTDLSPTPAVCGLPKEEALAAIHAAEDFERGCYGGFIGPYRNAGDFSFYVTLRCAMVNGSRAAIFTGGGITLQSDPHDEWLETRRKADTLAVFKS